MGFDLSQNNVAEKSEAGFEFELRHPSVGTGIGAFVTVRGAKSPKVKAYSRRKYQEFVQRQKMAKNKNREDDISLEEAEEMAVESALTRIISWKGLEEEGKEVKFTEDNARRILKDHDWIREQVIEESDLLANFI